MSNGWVIILTTESMSETLNRQMFQCYRGIKVRQIMNSPPICIRVTESTSTIVHILKMYSYNGFHVVDGAGSELTEFFICNSLSFRNLNRMIRRLRGFIAVFATDCGGFK